MKHSKTGLFLMELIVGILFFSLASALCIQIFVKADAMNNESQQQGQASRIATSIIENYKAEQLQDDILYFDENGIACQKQDADYLAQLDYQGDLLKISIQYHHSEVYKTEYYHYHQRTVEETS